MSLSRTIRAPGSATPDGTGSGTGGKDPPSAPRRNAELSWVAVFWWLSARRQRRQSGLLLIAGAFIIWLFVRSGGAPAGGEALYFSLVLALLLAGVVILSLLFTSEDIFTSTRFALLPLSQERIWWLRLVGGNPIRGALAIISLVWGIPHAVRGPPLFGLFELVQLCGWIFVALTLAQLLEDVIRLTRAWPIHIIGLAGIQLPIMGIALFSDPQPFVTLGSTIEAEAIHALLFTGSAPLHWEFIISIALLSLGLGLRGTHHRLYRRFSFRPLPPPANPRWTARMVELLSGSESSHFSLGLLIPLRFLSLRVAIFLLLLTSGAAFLVGLPYLLLILPFCWQRWSLNMFGPDVGGGELRYHLIGTSPERVISARTSSAALVSLLIVLAVALVCGLPGGIARPVIGPPSYSIYPLALIAGLSLHFLFGTAGERYSRMFPDPLPIDALLPERVRSGSAAALLLLLILNLAVLLVGAATLAMVALLWAQLLPAAPTSLQLSAITLTWSALNVGLYLMHRQRFLNQR